MITLGYIFRHIREDKHLQLQQVSEASGIDAALLSKIETGKRMASAQQVLKLAEVYGFDDATTLLIQRQSDEIINKLKSSDTQTALKALHVAEEKVAYGSRYLSLVMEAIYSKPIALESRRYIGSKTQHHLPCFLRQRRL